MPSFPGGSVVKNLPAMQKWIGSLGREDPLEERSGKPLQYSCLENSEDSGAWHAPGHAVIKKWDTTELIHNTNNKAAGLHCKAAQERLT